jgi:hypothetical protein
MNKATTLYIPEDDPIWDKLREARAEYKRLKEAGTPYWCIHEGREVSHPLAMWKDDGYIRPDGLQMQYKHGVICVECWGYIQEG